MPIPFYLSCALIVGLGIYAWEHRRQGWGLPSIIVLSTVTAWYVVDVIYNDYEGYRIVIGDASLEAAWWQVALFLVSFGILSPPVHRALNDRLLGRQSEIMRILHFGSNAGDAFQRQLDRSTRILAGIWLMMMIVGLIRTEFDVIGIFAPYLGHKTDPWGRGRLGGGFDAVLSLAGYFQIFLVASFGVIAAMSKNPKTRAIAMVICILAMPFYIFDRVRNAMIATMLPGVLAWVLLRLRTGVIVKVGILALAFLGISSWMKFVIENRTGSSIASAFAEGASVAGSVEAKHQGLNMFEELGYINLFIEKGSYNPNWGQRYFAEIANIVPRTIWKSKPMIGIDYAVARGLGNSAGDDTGVNATVSTGMIGQGVVNFGRFLGPVAAALIMALWVAVLAREDLLGKEPGRLLLFSTGLILTFNMGRDITLLVLYPFLFGWLLLRLWTRFFMGKFTPVRQASDKVGRRRVVTRVNR